MKAFLAYILFRAMHVCVMCVHEGERRGGVYVMCVWECVRNMYMYKRIQTHVYRPENAPIRMGLGPIFRMRISTRRRPLRNPLSSTCPKKTTLFLHILKLSKGWEITLRGKKNSYLETEIEGKKSGNTHCCWTKPWLLSNFWFRPWCWCSYLYAYIHVCMSTWIYVCIYIYANIYIYM